MYLLKENKNKPAIALALRIFGLLIATSAVTLQLFTNAIIGKGFMANHVLAYNTIQTNIMCLLLFLALLIKTLVVYIKTKRLEAVELNKSLQLAVTYFIFVVMLGYWPLLAPMVGIGNTPIEMANTLFLHLFTPLITIANVSTEPYYQFPIGDKMIPLMYPYPMFDPQVVGIWGLVGMSFVEVFSNMLCSYLFICLDHKIAKWIGKGHNNEPLAQ